MIPTLWIFLALTEVQVWNASIGSNTYSKATQYRIKLLRESQSRFFLCESGFVVDNLTSQR
jgi:hypothetical protein